MTNEQILDSIKPNSHDDRMFGCIIGAFVGDACGSYNEFNRNILSHDEMKVCMDMPGGGPFKLAPGQITDDSELAMMMMHGLLDKTLPKQLQLGPNENRWNYFYINNIGEYYKKWFESPPFDIGITTR